MLDFSLSDFIQEKTEAIPDNSLILITENAFHISEDDRIVFTPNSVKIENDEGTFEIQNASIPIRKVEKDQTIENVLESVIVKRPNADYINVNDISRSISWWIVNNAEELSYPAKVLIEYNSIDGKRKNVLYERTGKKKWEPTIVFGENTEKNPYVEMMEKMWG